MRRIFLYSKTLQDTTPASCFSASAAHAASRMLFPKKHMQTKPTPRGSALDRDDQDAQLHAGHTQAHRRAAARR